MGVSFQFQYGAIESYTRRSWICPVIIFQFQYGAIESHFLKFQFLGYFLFQFQYGAIESCNQNNHPLICFYISIPIWCDWEETSHLILLIPSNLFQFQYGAIESYYYSYQLLHLIHFNSNMVRLRAGSEIDLSKIRPISIPIWCDWEINTDDTSEVEWLHFNSNMVRLRVRMRKPSG